MQQIVGIVGTMIKIQNRTVEVQVQLNCASSKGSYSLVIVSCCCSSINSINRGLIKVLLPFTQTQHKLCVVLNPLHQKPSIWADEGFFTLSKPTEIYRTLQFPLFSRIEVVFNCWERVAPL